MAWLKGLLDASGSGNEPDKADLKTTKPWQQQRFLHGILPLREYGHPARLTLGDSFEHDCWLFSPLGAKIIKDRRRRLHQTEDARFRSNFHRCIGRAAFRKSFAVAHQLKIEWTLLLGC